MTTARNIIEKTAKKLSVLGRGQTLTSDQANDFLDTLNDMLSSWSVEGGMVYEESKDTFNADGSLSYTVGSGGDFNTIRPFDISAVYITQGTVDYPLKKYDEKQYSQITLKDIKGVAGIFYYDNNFPLSNLFLYPVPDSSYTVTIYSQKPIASFSSLDAVVSLPSGYERALIFNLAVESAPSFEKEASPTIAKIAAESKGNIFTYNKRNETNVASVDNAIVSNGNGYDIYRGY